jgi:hypothetical protein
MRPLVGTGLALLLASAAACGDGMVDGHFLGDASLRLRGVIGKVPGDPQHALVGAVWLGYSGLVDPTSGIETTVLPIATLTFPNRFECEILDAPSSAGRYALPDLTTTPAYIRIARLILFNDTNDDQQFTLGAGRQVALPDQMVARADHALLYVEQAPEHPANYNGILIGNWEDAARGYHLVELEPSATDPTYLGKVVPNRADVLFTEPSEDAPIF